MQNQIPKNWQKVKLNDLGFVSRGKSKHRPRNDSSLYGGDYPFIQTSDVKNANLYITDYSQTYNDKGLAQSKLWDPGTLLITIAANIAETAILKIPACFPDSIVGFIADPKKSDIRFVKYYINIIKLNMQSVSKGTTQDNLSVDKLLTFNFYIPEEVDNQKRIASVLSTYDDLIEINNKIAKTLEEMARAIFKEWFALPSVALAKEDRLPKGWEVRKVNDVVNIRSGFAFKSQSFDQNGKYKLVTIKNVQDGYFVVECKDSISNIPHNLPTYCLLSTGDILLSLTGNVGRICLVYGDNYLLNQRVAKLEPKALRWRGFVYLLFRQPEFRTIMERTANGSAQQNLSPIETGKIDIVIPNDATIDTFSHIVNPLLEKILILYQMNLNLRQTRDLLLPKLMKGEIRV